MITTNALNCVTIAQKFVDFVLNFKKEVLPLQMPYANCVLKFVKRVPQNVKNFMTEIIAKNVQKPAENVLLLVQKCKKKQSADDYLFVL